MKKNFLRSEKICQNELDAREELDLHGPDQLAPHGLEELELHGPDQLAPHGLEELELHGPDQLAPNGLEEQELHGPDQLAPHGFEPLNQLRLKKQKQQKLEGFLQD
ncbi:MAG: hypothetical protein ACFFB3_23785 [Candidatus Hodarchaeota archaeon]